MKAQKEGPYKKTLNLLLIDSKEPLKKSIISAVEGEFQSSISNTTISFFLKNGRIVSLPQSNTKDKQIIHFQELEYPISLGKSIQLENISNLSHAFNGYILRKISEISSLKFMVIYILA